MFIIKDSLFFSLLFITLLGVIGCASTTPPKSTSQNIDDQITAARVKSALIANRSVNGLRINVKSDDNVVTLSGPVTTTKQQKKAVGVASQVPGVEDVKDYTVIQHNVTAPQK